MRIRSVVVALSLVLSAAVSQAQTSAWPSASTFRVEWEPKPEHSGRPGVHGYVYNDSRYRVGNVRLRVEVLDGAKQVVRERLDWVYGDIAAGGRAYFSLRFADPTANYRMSVESFDLIAISNP